jgi:flagellar basal body-associated protein FliL
VVWYNTTINVMEYKETVKGKEEERSIWTLVFIIILGIIIVIAVVILGMVAYKMSKKDTEVEFKMKDFKSEIEKKKPGTGTDFDQRRGLQIPTESIMMKTKEPKQLEGTVTFDDEE